MQVDQELDCVGLLCPLPVLRARKRLLSMSPGQVLRVTATDAMAQVDLPHFCAQAGHVLRDTNIKDGVYVFDIICGPIGHPAGMEM